MSTGAAKTNGPNLCLCKYVHHEETIFPMNRENEYEYLVQPFRVPACKPESPRGSSMIHLKTLGDVFCLELLIKNYDTHF